MDSVQTDSTRVCVRGPHTSIHSVLPAEIKRHIVEDCGLGPMDLFQLSHVDQTFRSIAANDALYATWAAPLRPVLTLHNSRSRITVKNVSDRALVILCMREKCSRCHERLTSIVFIPAIARICARCLGAHNAYRALPVHLATHIFCLGAEDLKDLPCVEIVRLDGPKEFRMNATLVLDLEVRSVALKKHGDKSLRKMRRALRSVLDDQPPPNGYELTVADVQSGRAPFYVAIPKLSTAIRDFYDPEMERITRHACAISFGWLRLKEGGPQLQPRATCGICLRWKLSSSSWRRGELPLNDLIGWEGCEDRFFDSDEHLVHIRTHLDRRSLPCYPTCSLVKPSPDYVPPVGTTDLGDCPICAHRRAVDSYFANPQGVFLDDDGEDDDDDDDSGWETISDADDD